MKIPQSTAQNRTIDEQQNVALALRFFSDGWGTSESWRNTWSEIMAPNVRQFFNSAAEPIVGLEANMAFNAGLFDGFPDIAADIEEVICERDKVVVRCSLSGTHKGDFFGVTATGRPVRVSDMTLFTVRGGRIAEYRYMTDLLRVLATVGAVEGNIPEY